MPSGAFVNLSQALLSIARAPNYRPTFKLATWWTSLLGFLLSIGTPPVTRRIPAFHEYAQFRMYGAVLLHGFASQVCTRKIFEMVFKLMYSCFNNGEQGLCGT